MSVHYKFKSALESDTVSFDGLHISVADLKNCIMQQKRIGKNNDFDLQVTNAETKEVYGNEDALIPKNTSLLIARVPCLQSKPKVWEGYGDSSTPISKVDDLGAIGKAMDLSSLDASEEDKIKAMMSQSTQDYDPSNYVKIRGANQVGTVPANYRCYKCHQGGHWIKDCAYSQGVESMEIKKSTGIPRSFMVTVEGPQIQGAMITPNGSFAVPALDHQAYTEKPQPAPPPEESKTEIPEDLVCSLCTDLLTDAVMIPCCGDSFCDECIRSCLLESEEHECPACHEKDISPGTLIPNRYLRNSVTTFKSTTGYVKRPVYKSPPTPIVQQTNPAKSYIEPTTVKDIREQESKPSNTETQENTEIDIPTATDVQQIVAESKNDNLDLNHKEESSATKAVTEEPRGASPKPEQSVNEIQTIGNVANVAKRSMKNINERSPRRRYHKPSPTYQEHLHRNDRGGTPTIDEPGITPTTSVASMPAYHTAAPMYSSGPPPNMGMLGLPPPNIQVPTFGPIPSYPPPNPAGIPNFRLPPPGAAQFIPGGYNQIPRPMFDMGRVPAYPPVYTPGPRMSKNRDYHRDYPPRRGRSPPSAMIIDDPLEAFNRMLREKDERERRAKQRKARSYSRSSSRSMSPPPRKIRGSRSPRRRSHSRSFSLSRSRSRSFSPGPRISPAPRHFSPKRPHRKVHIRYPSPGRSPQRYRFKDDDRAHRQERERDNHMFNRDDREREYREREPREREFKYFDGYDRNRNKGRQQWNIPRKEYPGPPEQYYQPPEMAVQQPFVPSNRYSQHDGYPPHMPPAPHQSSSQIQHAPPMRKYDDSVVPPGTEQPPVPGLENAASIEERYQYTTPQIEGELVKQDISADFNIDSEKDLLRFDKMGGTPERKHHSPSRRQDKERDYQLSPDKHHKRRRHDDIVERKRDVSDDDRSSKKSKEKKKKKDKRERKEEERKKRKERREKREQEKLNKKAAMEEKERLEKKQKREIRKHDVEIQAANDEDEENFETEMYDNKNNYHEDADAKVEDLEDNTHYEEPTVDHNMEGDEMIENLREDSQDAHDIRAHKESPRSEEPLFPEKQEANTDLYGDLLTEGIDNTVIANYGKLKSMDSDSPKLQEENIIKQENQKAQEREDRDEGEITDDDEESEKDILELHTNEAELKMEVKSEVLAPLPERSKWEVDDDISLTASSATHRGDLKIDRPDKFGKVTNEVLKRAENAIFAKAINAIRPIEIKKISVDRAKLYSGERDKDKSGDELREEAKNIHITITSGANYENDVPPIEPDKSPPKTRLSVKERLGCKVDELDRIVKIEKPYDRNRSHSLSPLSRRSDLMSRNLGQGERRFDLDNRNRNNSRVNFRDRNRDFHGRPFRNERDNRRDIRNNHRDRKSIRQDRDRRKDNKRDDRKVDNDKKLHDKKKTSHSKSSSDEKDKHKRKDKKERKKDKTKRHKRDGTESEATKQTLNKASKNDEDKDAKMLPATDKRKPTLDEASFEPDYDLETESDKDDNKRDKGDKIKQVTAPEQDSVKKRTKPEGKKYGSSSSESSESSSDDRKRRKHKKHKWRKNRKDSSSSSSSESESETSEEERDKRKKRHKKKLKKKKKSKHKQ